MTIEPADLQLLLHIQHPHSLAGAARQPDLVPTVVSRRLAALEAHLRVAFSFGFGRVWLASVLAAQRHLHPAVEVEVDLHLFAPLPDMGGGQFDAAVWLWQPASPALVTRRLAPNRRVVVAAPSCLKRRGEPLTPEDLSSHDCLVVHEQGDSPAVWRLQNVGNRGAHGRCKATA